MNAGASRLRRGHRAAATGAGLLVPLLVVAVYHQAPGLWWRDDDFFQLSWIHQWEVAEYALDPAVWQRLPFRMVTPLLFVSLELDLALAGADPAPFYWHQLVALAAAGLAAWALLRLWLPVAWSLFGAIVLLAGPPLASAAGYLPVRHYVEGLALALLAAGLYVRGLRAVRPWRARALAALSALAWLAACLAKEVFVPLVLLLPLIPEGPFAAHRRLLGPHALALAAYLAYRRVLLGEWLGGYGFSLAPEEMARQTLRLPAELAREMVGAAPLAGVPALLLLVAATASAASRRRGGVMIAAFSLAAVLPVLPVAADVTSRYTLAGWTGLAIAAPFGLAGRRAGALLAGVTLVVLLGAGLATWHEDLARARRAGREAQALLALPAGDLLRRPASPPSSMRELPRFATTLLGRAVRAGWFYDDAYLCGVPEGGRLWEYDLAAQRLVDVTGRRYALRRAACAALASRAPLAARFERKGTVLRWELGPYRDGAWSFVLGDGREAFEVPRRGGFHVRRPEPLVLRLRHRASDGRLLYSPPLRVALQSGQSWSWSRQ